MSVNKNALIRYQILDRCFKNTGRMYFWEDLLDACNAGLIEQDPESSGIQRRQLFEDIKFMESEQGWSAPLERVRFGKRVYYRYESPGFSINNQPLNDSELEMIRSAVQILLRISGTPQFEWINEMLPMLETKLGLKSNAKEVIGFDSNIDLTGYHYLTPLFNAIINERVIDVEYQDFKSTYPYNVTLHPYYLKQYNNRWFVFGKNDDNGVESWNLALDRIRSISESRREYQKTNINWQDYFYDIIGVTRPEGELVQEIKLKFSPEVAPYVITKPLHPSQKFKTDATGTEVQIKVVPNKELEQVILSFGEHVEVLAPEQLKMGLKSRIKRIKFS